MKIEINLNEKNINQLRKKIAESIVKRVNDKLDKKKEVDNYQSDVHTSRTSTNIKYKITPVKGYSRNTKLISVRGMSLDDVDDVIDNLITSDEYVFISMRDPKCCHECSNMDYQVTQRIWTVDEIKNYMGVGGFTYTDVKGKKHVYKWKGKLQEIEFGINEFVYYKGQGENLLHPHCRCKWVPLSIYLTNRWKNL